MCLVDKVVADDDGDHPVVIVHNLQPFQLPDKTDLGIGLEQFLQFMVQFSWCDILRIFVLIKVDTKLILAFVVLRSCELRIYLNLC